MLPTGFKKDSRVWLHKNPHIYTKTPIPIGVLCAGSDDPYEQYHEDTFYNHHLITDEYGRVFKKDSRTWLHKSSAKKSAKTTNTPAPVHVHGAKVSWRQARVNQELRFPSEVSGEGIFRTRSSTEMVRVQNCVNKLKKKKRSSGNYMDSSFSPTLDFRSVKEVPGKDGNMKHSGASYPDISLSRRESCEVSAYASDYCITFDQSSPSRTLPTSNSASENEEEEEEDSELRRRNSAYVKTALSKDYPAYPMYRTGSIELSKDGLQALIKMEQNRRHSNSLTRRFDIGHIPLVVSPNPELSETRLIADASYSLSDELVSSKILHQAPNSAEQVTKDRTHVRSPEMATPTDQ